MKDELDRVRVQLAGCLVASEGQEREQSVFSGNYGWSPAYQSVIELRKLYEQQNVQLSASEALFGFMGWLTTLETPVTFSARDNAGIAAELVGEFCKANNLAEPRKDWYENFVYPKSPTTWRCSVPPEKEVMVDELVKALQWYLENDYRSVKNGILEDVKLCPAYATLKHYSAQQGVHRTAIADVDDTEMQEGEWVGDEGVR